MSELVRKLVMAAAGLALLAGGVARAEYTETEVLQQRLTTTEKKLDKALEQIDNLTRLVGQQPARQEVDRDQVVQIVQEQMEKSRKPNALDVYWKEGLRLDSQDGAFKLKIGGRLMADWAAMAVDDDLRDYLSDDGFDELNGDAEVRRARFYMEGSIYDVTKYKLQLDFAGGSVEIKDAYLAFDDLLPCGELKVGHFHEPFGLEELTSSKYITFMERALPMEAFAPSRNLGIGASGDCPEANATWAVGVYWDTGSDTVATYDQGVAVTGRLTWAPVYQDGGAEVVHLGVASSYRSPDMARFRSRPEVHLSSMRFADTGSLMGTDSVWLLGLEGAWVHGPFSMQAEAVNAEVQNSSYGDPTFKGAYVQGSYFLTGEHRNYKKSSGVFDRVKPQHNFDGKGNWGAWEAAARYSYLDLDDASVEGGKLSDVTLGLNWYLNPNMRVMWNYVRSALHADSTDGTARAFMMRFQVDF